jgi:hypothetical protein
MLSHSVPCMNAKPQPGIDDVPLPSPRTPFLAAGCSCLAAPLLRHTPSPAPSDRARLQLWQHSDTPAAVHLDNAAGSRCRQGSRVHVAVSCCLVALSVGVWVQQGSGGEPGQEAAGACQSANRWARAPFPCAFAMGFNQVALGASCEYVQR